MLRMDSRLVGQAMWAAAYAICVCPALAQTQWREDQAPVLTPAPTPIKSSPDVAGQFRSQYQQAGSPRILLFWNVAFDDSTEVNRQMVEITRKSESSSATELQKETAGPAGGSTLHESDRKGSETVERTSGSRIHDPAKQSSGLSPRNAAQLESAFREQLQMAGVRIFDRAASIRLTQAEQDRVGVDPKLIEADAIRSKADYVLQVILVPDTSTPLGAAFKITLMNVKSGQEVMSSFSTAVPALPQYPVRFVATDSGFERRQFHPQATSADIGVALARDAMGAMGPGLLRQQ